MYRENKIGARMDPCGTPQEWDAEGEEQLAMLTAKLLFVR